MKTQPKIVSRGDISLRTQRRPILVVSPIAILFIVSILTVFCFCTNLKGITVSSVQSGIWNEVETWNTGSIPVVTDDVVIGNGHLVTINNNHSCASLAITAPSAVGTSQLLILATGKTPVLCNGTPELIF